MAKVTLRRLQRHLYKAADILRNKMNAWDYQNYIFGMLFLKRASDEFDYQQAKIVKELMAEGLSEKDAREEAQEKDHYVARGVFYVPEAARWTHIRDDLSANIGQELDKALAALQNENIAILKDVLDNIHFANSRHKLKDSTLARLIKHFNKISLCSVDFEFPDLPGAAYEYLIKVFADKVQSGGGEYYTPRDVVRLMARVVFAVGINEQDFPLAIGGLGPLGSHDQDTGTDRRPVEQVLRQRDNRFDQILVDKGRADSLLAAAAKQDAFQTVDGFAKVVLQHAVHVLHEHQVGSLVGWCVTASKPMFEREGLLVVIHAERRIGKDTVETDQLTTLLMQRFGQHVPALDVGRGDPVQDQIQLTHRVRVGIGFLTVVV